MNLETVARTIAGNHGLGEDDDFRGCDVRRAAVYLVDDGLDVISLFRALVPGMQTDSKHTARRTHTAQHAHTCGLCTYLDLRNVADFTVYFLHDSGGLLQIGAGRRLNVNIDRTHILVRDQSGFRRLHQIYQPAARQQ